VDAAGKKIKILTGALCLIFLAALALGCASPFSSPPRQGDRIPAPGDENAREPIITLYNKEKGKVEKIKMEKYIEGVVAAEMDTSWPIEALAAQAIIARTFTLKKIQEGGVKKYNTDASTDEQEFQAYDASKINDNVRKAVARSRGIVVTHNGKYINGWFHADAGGRTAASAVEGLNFTKEKAPYIHSVNDPGFKSSPPENRSWKAVFPVSEVRQKIQNSLGRDPGPIREVKILERGPSGRVTKVKVGNLALSGPSLRLALGSEVMRSTLLTQFKVSGGRLIAAGKGYGHGVGMSQWGAKVMAENGKSAEEIIKYYYKDVEIQKVWR